MVYSAVTAKLLTLACLTGFIGDAILQYASKFMGGETGWGLKEYFRQHGVGESLFIAAGMMTLFYVIVLVIFDLPPKWYFLAIFGVVIDLIFRLAMVFPSLAGYYAYFNYFWSAFWMAIPMLIPLALMRGYDMLYNKI